jgi:hypothetical protein
MEFFIPIAMIIVFVLGAATGVSTASPGLRETTVKFCIEKPTECKKDYDFYQMREEFEASREKTK